MNKVNTNRKKNINIMLGIVFMSDTRKPIDKVTVDLFDTTLRGCGINLSKHTQDKILDIIELLEDKGDDVTLKDICKLQAEWAKQKS